MVARSVDAPRTVPERVAAASERLDEIARQQSQGIESLRSAGEAVLRLTGASSQPTLQPDGVDVSLRFRDAGVEIRDYAAGSLRDLLLRDLVGRSVTLTGTSKADLLYVNGITCYFAFSADTVRTNGLTVNGQTNAQVVYCQDIHQEGFGLFTAGIKNTGRTTSAGFTDTTASDRALKRDFEPLGHSALDAVRAAPIQRWRYDPDAVADLHTPHAAPDDGPSVDLALHPEPWHVGPMVDDLPDDAVLDGDYGKVPDLGGMGRYTWEAVRELADIVDTQAARIAALEARLAELTPPGA